MIDTLYIEKDIADHPRTKSILSRFPRATAIPCERYGEIFNRKAQNFRLQKRRPALILARKFKNFVLPAPDGYSVGGTRNYYFSHMLNCIYDCRYCFLQGMYRSANYVLFANYEGFEREIVETVAGADGEECWFFSGYDCDSLALEPVTGFVEYVLSVFARLPQAWLELRTKSTQIRCLLEREPLPNCVVAFSLSPEPVVHALEHKAPPLQRRLEAMAKLQSRGWRLGLRFDPLIYTSDYARHYAELFERVFAHVDPAALHSVSLGGFRLPEPFFDKMVGLYPEEPLFAGPLERRDKMVAYRAELEEAMTEHCAALLLDRIPQKIFYPCSAAA